MKTQIWIIDDNTIDNFISSTVLGKCISNVSIVCHTDPVIALRQLQSLVATSQELPAVIFLDISMPVMNGFEFLNEFEKLPIKPEHYPVILMLSSSSDKDDVRQAMSHKEVRKYLVKPLTTTVIEELRNEQIIGNQ